MHSRIDWNRALPWVLLGSGAVYGLFAYKQYNPFKEMSYAKLEQDKKVHEPTVKKAENEVKQYIAEKSTSDKDIEKY